MNKPVQEVQHEPASRRVMAGLTRIAVALRSRAWKDASVRGLTPTQGQILAFLAPREDTRLTDVAKALSISAPTASDAVATLERKGLVRKQVSKADPRAISLRLSATGKREVQRMLSGTSFLERAVESLPAAEQEYLLVVLMKLLRVMQHAGDIHGSAMCLSCGHFQPYVSQANHQCAYYRIEFGNSMLRLECPHHKAVSDDEAKLRWEAFAKGLTLVR